MKQYAIPFVALLAACTGGVGGGGGGGTPSTIPDVLKQNLDSAAYAPGAGTITVDLVSLDTSGTTYTRSPGLDVGGYEAYAVQDNALQRNFIALFKQSARGNVQAGTVADGGQFVNYFGGGTYGRVDVFSRPASGLAVYEGSYVGLLNTGASTGPLAPSAPYRVSGDAQINADFRPGGSVNGGIVNRTNVDTGLPLANVFLAATAIDANGEFQGEVQFSDLTVSGDYGGLFAGLGATDIAGIMVFNPVQGNTDLVEHGVFVLPCTITGSGVPCP